MPEAPPVMIAVRSANSVIRCLLGSVRSDVPDRHQDIDTHPGVSLGARVRVLNPRSPGFGDRYPVHARQGNQLAVVGPAVEGIVGESADEQYEAARRILAHQVDVTLADPEQYLRHLAVLGVD